jgi:hypothetical protein
MEAWNRVQGPPGGNAEGEELVHEGHEALGIKSVGCAPSAPGPPARGLSPWEGGRQGVCYELMKTPCRRIRGVPLQKRGTKVETSTVLLNGSARHATLG